jgi:protein-tyrosine-phosphatase
MGRPPLKVLFLCTGNSARSILAEYLLRSLDPERFATRSAGSHPRGEVHPLALRVLRERYGIDAREARSKSWEELRQIPFDLVITVCDQARESCPLWPVGRPTTLHWGMEDPAAVEGGEPERLAAFEHTASLLAARLRRLARRYNPQIRGTTSSVSSSTSRVSPAPRRGKSKKR